MNSFLRSQQNRGYSVNTSSSRVQCHIGTTRKVWLEKVPTPETKCLMNLTIGLVFLYHLPLPYGTVTLMSPQ